MLDSLTRSPFQLRGNLFTLSVLQLQSDNLAEIERELKMVVRQAPKFFENAPVVIDLQQLEDSSQIDLIKLGTLLRQYGIIPVGARGGRSELQQAAIAAGLAILSNAKQEEPSLSSKKSPEPKAPEKAKPSKTETPAKAQTLIITKPVRSGQQLYAKGGDLIVIGSVSQGAECLADGSIHVYGPLRGRALAGISGDTKARIFTQNLDAELISIAGRYMVNEALKNHLNTGAKQISLQDDKLSIDTL